MTAADFTAAAIAVMIAWFSLSLPETVEAAPSRKQDSLSYTQDRLVRNLFRYYEKSVVAQMRSRQAVVVSIAFTLTQINNLDEKTQVLTTTAWMEVLWTDERLSWDPEEYNDTKSIVVPPELMWLPDIGLQNSAHEIYHNSLVDKKFKVTLYSNGNILWTPGGKFYTNCELNIDFFPFDDQRCILHFTNWAYNGNEMNLTVTYDAVKLDNYQVNGEWDIMSTSAHRVDKFYACCGNVPYPSVYFTINLRRKYLYYVMNVIAPCIMLSVLVTLVFYLPSGTGEKISLGVTVFLAFIIFLLMVAESIPQNSDSVPILSVYLATFLALTTSSLFTSVVVLHVHHLSPDKKLPSWLRRFIFGFLARVLCMKSIHARYGSTVAGSTGTCSSLYVQSSTCSTLPLLPKGTSYHDDGFKIACQGKSAAAWSTRVPGQQGANSNGRGSSAEDGADVYQYQQQQNENVSGRVCSCHVEESMAIATCRRHHHYRQQQQQQQKVIFGRDSSSDTSSILSEMLDHVKFIARERLMKEKQEMGREEWQAVAKVIDRFLLFSYIIFIVVATLIILIAQPLLSQA